MATKTTYTKNADGTITSRFDQVPDTPTAPAQPTNNVSYARQDNGQYTQYTQNADGTITSRFNVQNPVQPAQPTTQAPTQQTGTTYTRNADGTITSRFNQPTQPAQSAQNQNQITDWQSLPEDQKTIENLSKLVNNRYGTQSTIDGASVNANVGDMRYGWYLDEAKNPIKTEGTKLKQGEVQPNMAPTGLVFDRTSDWSALRPQDKTINNLQKLIEARYGTLAEVEGDRVVADIGGKMYQWTLDQNGNPVKTEVPADNTQFNSGEILEQLKANPNLDLSTYDPTQASIAKNNFTKIQNFDGMNSDQLNESLQSGALLVGTEVRNNMNPQQRQIVDMVSTLNMIKGIFLDPLLINENAEKNILANAGPLAQALEDNYLSTAEVDEITITPEMKQMKNNADFWGDEMNRLRTNYEYLEDDIEEELKGQNATASYRDRLMAKEGKALYRALTTAQRNYQMYYGQYNDERERAMQLLNTNIQLYQKAQDRAYEEEQQLKEFQRQVALQNYGMVTDYMNTLDERAYKEQRYEYEMAKELEQAQKKLEMQLQIEYGDLNSDNPMLVQQAIRRSIQGMYDTYSSLVPGLENPEISYEKVMQKIANGMSPAQALQERHDEIKNSKRLQNALANEQNKLNYDNWKMQQDMNPSPYSGYSGYSGYSPSYGTSGVSGGLTSNGIGGYTSSTGRNYTMNSDGSYSDGTGITIPAGAIVSNGYNVNHQGGQQYSTLKETYVEDEGTGYPCGTFAKLRSGSNITLGDINNRRKLFTDKEAKAGGMVFFDKGYDKTYGHVAYVKAVDEANGRILIEETNIKGNNEYRQRWVPISSAYGFYNQTPAVYESYAMSELTPNQSQSSSGMQAQFSPRAISLINSAIEGKTVNDKDIESVFGSRENFNKAYDDYVNAGYNAYNGLTQKEIMDAQNSINNNEYGLNKYGLTPNQMVVVTATLKKAFGNPSDSEREFLVQLVQEHPNRGVNELILATQGFTQGQLDNKDVQDALYTFLMAGGDIGDAQEFGKVMREFTNSMNTGNGKYDTNAGYRYIFTELLDGDNKNVKSGELLSGLNKTYTAINAINKNKDKIGPVAGRFNKVLSKILPNEDFQAVDTLLQGIQAERRKDLLGSAISEHEMDLVDQYINGNTKMNAENLITLLEVANRVQIIDYLSERAVLGEEQEVAELFKNAFKNRLGISLLDKYINNYNNLVKVENNQTSERKKSVNPKYGDQNSLTY